MTNEDAWHGFFKVGGALYPDDRSYVVRAADEELLRLVLRGEYCNLLTARQMGKSSLMVRTAARLRERGVHSAEIDISGSPGTRVTADEWYLGLVRLIREKLSLKVDEVNWWNAQGKSSSVQRFSRFMQEVVLAELEGAIAIFLDEIDTTLTLPFTDDFFASIRAMYNEGASDPESEYKRLTFVLVGVARPADLIKDRTRTPYNIGRTVELDDFSFEDAKVLLNGLQEVYSPERSKAILKRALYWTRGQPYLTQKICDEVVKHRDGRWTNERIDQLVESLFFQEGQIRSEVHLQWIDDYIREKDCREEMLQVYREILAGKKVKDEERSIEKSYLKLSGVVKATPDGFLEVRNCIYKRVFGPAWEGVSEAERAEPIALEELKSQQASVRWRWVSTVVGALLLVASVAWTLSYWRGNKGTPTPQSSPSPTSTQVIAILPTSTPTPQSQTDTPTPTLTLTVTPAPTGTPTPTPMPTSTRTSTPTPTPTATVTSVPSPTATPTFAPTATPTVTPTFVPTPALLSAPDLFEPEPGTRLSGQVLLKWIWRRRLTGSERFVIRLQPVGNPEWPDQWVSDSDIENRGAIFEVYGGFRFELPFDLSSYPQGEVSWSMVVFDEVSQAQISEWSEKWQIFIGP